MAGFYAARRLQSKWRAQSGLRLGSPEPRVAEPSASAAGTARRPQDQRGASPGLGRGSNPRPRARRLGAARAGSLAQVGVGPQTPSSPNPRPAPLRQPRAHLPRLSPREPGTGQNAGRFLRGCGGCGFISSPR